MPAYTILDPAKTHTQAPNILHLEKLIVVSVNSHKLFVSCELVHDHLYEFMVTATNKLSDVCDKGCMPMVVAFSHINSSAACMTGDCLYLNLIS